MFELPEIVTLTKQINQTLQGKTIRQGSQGNSPHKFVWYNHSHEEFAALTQGKTVGEAWARGRWLFVPFEPGYVLLLGECGGKALYHPAGANPPAKYHLLIAFEDGSHFSVTTQMWGAMELYERGQETRRPYVKGMRTTPVESEFTFDYFNGLDRLAAGGREAQREGAAHPGPAHPRSGQRHRPGHHVQRPSAPAPSDHRAGCGAAPGALYCHRGHIARSDR